MRFWIASILLLSAWAGTEPTVPTGPAGEVLHAWLDAFNSGDRAQLASYLSKYEPEQKSRVDQLMSFREQTGGFQLIRIEKGEPTYIEALVKERDGSNYARLSLRVSDSTPPIVKQNKLNIVSRPADQPTQPRLTFSQAVQAVDETASDLAAKDRFSGAVLIARDGRIVLGKAYGLADRDRHSSNSVDTQFRIGSMNKMFTATAVLQLVTEGKIDLAAPIGKYLPDYPNRDVATKVTIRHLLTHTGGTGDIFTPEYEKQRLEIRELDDYIKLFGARGPEFEPGSKWSYSNYGFVLLGAVIEKVSGMSYYDYVRKNIFRKAGMDHTDSAPEAELVPNRSVGYTRKDGHWASNADTLPWRATSAGGGYSTVGDLYRFAQALSNGELITPELFSQMTSEQAGTGQMPAGQRYGFGMMVAEEPQGKRFGHGGGAPGMNGELRVYPKTRTVIAVVANLDPPSATRVADVFDERMPLQ